MRDALERRRAERVARLATATQYVRALSQRVELLDAVVIGSTARGDFNLWSDIDVLVIAEDFPARAPDRALLLAQDVRGGVQAIGFTPDELGAALSKGNPMAREALASGERVVDSGILLRLQKTMDATQSWFWAPEWQSGERAASRQIHEGRVERFTSAEELMAALRERSH